MSLLPTPGQTVGPFFRYGLEFEGSAELVPPRSPGAIRLYGTVTDGAGDPVPDALVEIWHSAPDGSVPAAPGSFHRDGGTFTGWGRAHTADDGGYEFWTLEPGGFIAVVLFARGLLDRVHTRIYPPERADAAFLGSLAAGERATLVAQRDADGALRHDIRLQGAEETVFLAFR